MVKKISKSRLVVLLIVLGILMFLVVDKTVAWLMKETDLLIDKFTYGNIKISISESSVDNGENAITHQIIPGTEIVKDTVVTVFGDSEDCWLFIEIEQTANFDEFMDYELEDGWIKLYSDNGVYYRKVDKMKDSQKFSVLKDDIINVKTELTKESFASINSENYPSISILAYAMQRNSDIDSISTAEKAWLLVDNQEN